MDGATTKQELAEAVKARFDALVEEFALHDKRLNVVKLGERRSTRQAARIGTRARGSEPDQSVTLNAEDEAAMMTRFFEAIDPTLEDYRARLTTAVNNPREQIEDEDAGEDLPQAKTKRKRNENVSYGGATCANANKRRKKLSTRSKKQEPDPQDDAEDHSENSPETENGRPTASSAASVPIVSGAQDVAHHPKEKMTKPQKAIARIHNESLVDGLSIPVGDEVNHTLMRDQVLRGKNFLTLSKLLQCARKRGFSEPRQSILSESPDSAQSGLDRLHVIGQRLEALTGTELWNHIEERWNHYHFVATVQDIKKKRVTERANKDRYTRKGGAAAAHLDPEEFKTVLKFWPKQDETKKQREARVQKEFNQEKRTVEFYGVYGVGMIIVCAEKKELYSGNTALRGLKAEHGPKFAKLLHEEKLERIVEDICTRACNVLRIAFDDDAAELEMELKSGSRPDNYVEQVSNALEIGGATSQRLKACLKLFSRVEYPKDNILSYAMRSNNSPPQSWDSSLSWPEELDVTTGNELCDMCMSRQTCDCITQILPANMTRICYYGKKGRGLEATILVPNSTIIGQVTGTFQPLGTTTTAEMIPFTRKVGGKKVEIAKLNTSKNGNQFRLLNHSHKPNAGFYALNVGGKARILIRALRDIRQGEEITVLYGDSHWQGSITTCFCGERWKDGNGQQQTCPHHETT